MRRIAVLLGDTLLCATSQRPSPNKPFHPEIPKVWDDAAMESIELPRAAKVDVRPLASSYYYTIPERRIWCHTPPLYTNNMLKPVEVFTIPDETRAAHRIAFRKTL